MDFPCSENLFFQKQVTWNIWENAYPDLRLNLVTEPVSFSEYSVWRSNSTFHVSLGMSDAKERKNRMWPNIGLGCEMLLQKSKVFFTTERVWQHVCSFFFKLAKHKIKGDRRL